MNNGDPLEAEVSDALCTLRQRYEQLKILTDQLVAGDQSPTEFQAQLDRIQSERQAIETLQNQSQTRYDQYIASREHASPEVRELTRSVTDLIQSLIANFSELESETRKSQARLQPQVNENLRAVQMKSAYSRRTI